MGDRDDPNHLPPPEDTLAWTRPRFRAESMGDTLSGIRVLDQHDRAYTLHLVRQARQVLMALALSSERDTELWVLDGDRDGPLLVTTTRGVRDGDTVALVAPRVDGTDAPNGLLVEMGSDVVPGRAHVVGLVRWPVWFGPSTEREPEEEVPKDA